MNLKNYTSSVPVATTVARIEHFLAQAGVDGIAKQFQNGQLQSLTFLITISPDKPPITIRLPANVQGCQESLYKDYMKSVVRPRKSKDDFLDQAQRTAWKLQQDWVEVQCSLIRLKQVDFVQVFMPYVWDGRQTFYDKLKAGGFRQLAERNS